METNEVFKLSEENIKFLEQHPGIKLIKNRNGYNWELKIIDLDIDELEKLNNEMINRFGR
jgi:hypothetical protein